MSEPTVISNSGEVATFSGNEVAPVLRQRMSQHDIFSAYTNQETENSVMPYQEFVARFAPGVSLSHLVATLGKPYEPVDEVEAETCSYCSKEAITSGRLEIAGIVGGTKSYAHLSLCEVHKAKIERQHPGKFKVVPQD